MSRRVVTVALPKGIFRVTKPSGKVYWYHQARRGKPDAGPITALGEYDTPAFWEAVAKIGGKAHEPEGNTFNALIDDHIARLEKSGATDGTLQTYKSALRHVRLAWGKLDPARVTIANILAMQDTFHDRPSMGNMVYVQLKALMKLAVQKGWRSDNPVREVDRQTETPDSAKPLSAEAWAAITSDAAPEALRRFAILGRATGQRISDIVRMTPAGREQEGLNCTIKKLGDIPHWCILTQEEIATIDGWKQFRAAPYVLRPDGKRYTPDTLRQVWNEFVATEAGAALKGFTPHDLRATKVCDERLRGKSHQQIAAIVNFHISQVIHYSRHIDKKAAARGTGTERE
jgi:integrase